MDALPPEERSLQNALTPLKEYAGEISEGVIIKTVSINSQRMSIEGYAPVGRQKSSEDSLTRRFPDTRPGYERFESAVELGLQE